MWAGWHTTYIHTSPKGKNESPRSPCELRLSSDAPLPTTTISLASAFRMVPIDFASSSSPLPQLVPFTNSLAALAGTGLLTPGIRQALCPVSAAKSQRASLAVLSALIIMLMPHLGLGHVIKAASRHLRHTRRVCLRWRGSCPARGRQRSPPRSRMEATSRQCATLLAGGVTDSVDWKTGRARNGY